MRIASLLLFSLAVIARADPSSTAPPADLRENVPSDFAITNAHIVVSADRTIERGTLVFRDGVIVTVSEATAVPATARTIDLGGKWIYPGLIDAFSEAAPAREARPGEGEGARQPDPAPPEPPPAGGAANWNSQVLADFRVDRTYQPDAALNKTLRSVGFVARLAAPSRGILKGMSAIVDTSDRPAGKSIVLPAAAEHVALTPARRRGRNPDDEDDDRYPSSPMGAFTLVRQTLSDADWYARASAAADKNSALPRPDRNAPLEALAEHIAAKRPFIIDANDELYDLRVGRIAAEFSINAIVRGSGQEYRRLKEIAAMKLPIIVPLSFPKPPVVTSPELAANASLADLMDWDLAPENPARIADAGITFAFSTHGLRSKDEFLKNLRKAVERGLDKAAALRAVTTTPAKLLGIDRSLGSLEAGKLASFIVVDRDLFDDKSKISETWVNGVRHEVVAAAAGDARGRWRAAHEGRALFDVVIDGEPGHLNAKLTPSGRFDPNAPASAPTTRPTTAASQPSTVDAKDVSVNDALLSFTFESESFGPSGVAMLSVVMSQDDASGMVVQPDGASLTVMLSRTGPATATTEPSKRGRKRNGATSAPTSQSAASSYAVNFPLGDFGRETPPQQPRSVLFRHATIWTSGPAGTLTDTDVLISNGKITSVGRGIAAADGGEIVDCEGKFLAPGIVDCHSHIATDGGVNEGGQNITAEVRIGDFIDPDDINIYRQLASGITAVNVLHGSANAIGGQCQLIKLRWSMGPEDLKFAGAAPSIKFALGENPRGVNGDEPPPGTGRYPQTRMGVAELIRNAFAAAKDYRTAQRREQADANSALPVRKDLELEALAEVLEGTRIIHCHSYRQDEILELLRTCEKFGVKIGTLQHILEGYKVADAIKQHGAGASSFSDWWAYKLEVYDAIPYNGALMHDQGIVVSYNSDDAEMARRLNSESAKATKYGGVPAVEAFKFVTINPARQLRVGDRVGSIEVGKDADLAIWSGPPMSLSAICEQTWVDGRKFFDRADDTALRQRDERMRQALIQKILASDESPGGGGDSPPRERDLWPRYDEYCGHHHEGE